MNEETQEIFEEPIFEEAPIKIMEEDGDTARGSSLIGTVTPKSFLEKIIVALLLGLVFLMPIFFLPINGIFPGFAKNIVLSAVVLSALTLTFILWIKQETFILPKSPIFVSLFFLVIVSAFSSLVSGSFFNSFFGIGSEITTSFELIILGLLLVLCALFFNNKERVFYAFTALFVSAFFVFLFQILHFIFPNLMSFAGISPNKTINLIGQWSDLGIFSGIMVIMSLVTLEKMKNAGVLMRRFLYFFLAVSLFFHSMVAYSNSWLILVFVSLATSIFIFSAYDKKVSLESDSLVKKWSRSPSFFVAIFSLVMVLVGSQVNTKIFEMLKIPATQEVRPSWVGTYQISRGVFTEGKKELFFGVGPNRFFVPWQKYRPKEVNYTDWWWVDFNEGVSTISSTAVSSGVLGFLGWISFLIIFFVGSVRVLRKKFVQMDLVEQYVVTASFLVAGYCWVVASLNTVGVVPFSFAFIFTGIFLGTLGISGSSHLRTFSYSHELQKGFAFVVILLVLTGSSVATGYAFFKRTTSFFTYRDALVVAGGGNFEKADKGMRKAISIIPNDMYYRSFSILNSYQAQQLILRTDLSPDKLREQFGTAFRTAVDSANKSIEMDSENYQNWAALGGAYSVLVPLGIEKISDDSYVQAKKAYEQASLRNPYNPQIFYLLSVVALSKNKPDEAISYAKKALALKSNYSEALIIISQIEEDRGDSDKALDVMEKASAIDFSDPAVLFRLGYLRYKKGNYTEALPALEKAVQMVPEYSNAKYFLGLTYSKFGRVDEAIKQFKDIDSLNPGRTDIIQILKNLTSGHSPFAETAVVVKENPSLLTASTTEQKADVKKTR